MYKTAFNTTSQPVAIDEAGHRIGGGDWGPVNTTDPVASKALADRRLVIVEQPDGDVDPRAAEAFEATARLVELAGLPADKVKKLAEKAGVEADTKAEAVDTLGREKGAR